MHDLISSSCRDASPAEHGNRGGPGEDADNSEIQKALTDVAEGNDSDCEEEIDHGLEDLGIAFTGELNQTQEKYKSKLAAKLKKVQ